MASGVPCPHAARRSGRPAPWVQDRGEAQEDPVREYRQYIGGQWTGAEKLYDDFDPYRARS